MTGTDLLSYVQILSQSLRNPKQYCHWYMAYKFHIRSKQQEVKWCKLVKYIPMKYSLFKNSNLGNFGHLISWLGLEIIWDEIDVASVNLLLFPWRNWWDLISISLVLCCSLRSFCCFCIKLVQGISGDEVFHWGYTWVCVGEEGE